MCAVDSDVCRFNGAALCPSRASVGLRDKGVSVGACRAVDRDAANADGAVVGRARESIRADRDFVVGGVDGEQACRAFREIQAVDIEFDDIGNFVVISERRGFRCVVRGRDVARFSRICNARRGKFVAADCVGGNVIVLCKRCEAAERHGVGRFARRESDRCAVGRRCAADDIVRDGELLGFRIVRNALARVET